VKVALVGGFGAPPVLLRPLRDALRSDGNEARIAPLGLNLDCGEVTAQRLESWLDAFADGESIAVVGHSRGGQLARVVAVRRSELVARLVTVATPWSIGPPKQPGVQSAAALLRAIRRLGLNPMGALDCATADCCARFRVDVAAKPAARWSVLWSSRDRFAGDDSRPPVLADTSRDISTGHTGAVTSRQGIDCIRGELM